MSFTARAIALDLARRLAPLAPLAPLALLVAFASFACVLTASRPAAADATALLPVSGVLSSAGGGPVADGAYVFLVKLYDAADAEVFVWDDAVAGVPVQSGFFHFLLGGTVGKTMPEALLTAGKPLWLGIQVGSDPELARQPLRDVPRAFFAHVAAVASAVDCSGCLSDAMIADGTISGQKVAFTFAGSGSKGGPANEALHAVEADHAVAADTAVEAGHAATADSAKLADSAKQADFAKNAENATSADEALAAAKLQCSGCVSLDQLGADVAGGFVSTKGGTVQGELVVDGSLNLGASSIKGGRFAAIDIAAVPCDGAGVGRVAFGSVKTRLYFCDGSAWQRITICAESCPPASTVACGAAIVNDCGDSECVGKGSACPGGAPCVDDKCVGPGESAQSAAASCKALLAAVPGIASGVYWLDPDGADVAFDPFKARCNMDLEGGGWTLAGRFNLNATGTSFGGVVWRADNDVNVDYLNAADDDAIFGVGHLSRDKVVKLTTIGDRKMMTYVKQHSTQKYKYCWNHYAAGPDSNWSFVGGKSSGPTKGSCGKLGWDAGFTCGATSTSCASHDANYTMDGHWMHANGLNQGTLSGTVQTYCGDNSTSGIGSSGAATGARRGTCYLYVR